MTKPATTGQRRRRDTTTEALETLCDLTRTRREAMIAIAPLLHRKDKLDAAYIVAIGMQTRAHLEERHFDEVQVLRWADDGGPA